MSTSQTQRPSQTSALQHATGLSEVYLKLEGFVESAPSKEATDFTPACFVDPKTQLPENTWKDAFITFSVIFGCLITSSVALGFGASRVSQGLQQLSEHIHQQATDPILTPTRWH
ncbi:MAG: hypothetical protein AAGN15_08265 [Cyanobacteria bacterium J06581_3]